MEQLDPRTLVNWALEFGASLAGVASVADLRRAPSFALAERGVEVPGGRGGRPGDQAAPPGQRVLLPAVQWPPGAASVLVIAVAHPAERPDLDWWWGRNDPPGNRLLSGIVSGLCRRLTEEAGVTATHLPYHVEKGGIYLKDAAVLAGLGAIGRNNLLVTPEFGPRVRLRALALSADLPSSGPPHFDPCAGCPAPCQTACPREAFATGVAGGHEEETARRGAAGGFSRARCFLQMDADVAAAAAPASEKGRSGNAEIAAQPAAGPVIKYCRACELGCLA